MTSDEGKKYIESGWRASGIADAIKMGKANLPSIDPFDDLDPLLPSTEESGENFTLIAISAEQNGESKSDDENDSSEEDSEWEYDEHSAFDVFSD